MIDAELLREVDQAARRAGVSRSAFICDALREYLKRLVEAQKARLRLSRSKCREESRHGTQECVRHGWRELQFAASALLPTPGREAEPTLAFVGLAI